jgi:mRNA interferase HigB
VRLIKRSTLRHYASRFPKADRALNDWARLVLSGTWQNLVETRRMFPHADQVKVKSGKLVTIFNFLTHAEYSRNHWKTRL